MESNLKLNINIPWVKGLSVTGNASIDKNFVNDKLWQNSFLPLCLGQDNIRYRWHAFA